MSTSKQKTITPGNVQEKISKRVSNTTKLLETKQHLDFSNSIGALEGYEPDDYQNHLMELFTAGLITQKQCQAAGHAYILSKEKIDDEFFDAMGKPTPEQEAFFEDRRKQGLGVGLDEDDNLVYQTPETP